MTLAQVHVPLPRLQQGDKLPDQHVGGHVFPHLQIAAHLGKPGKHVHHIDVPILIGGSVFQPLGHRLLLPIVAGRQTFQRVQAGRQLLPPRLLDAVSDLLPQRLGRPRLPVHQQDAHLQRQRHEQAAHIALPLDKRDGPRRQDQRVEAVVVLIVPLRQHDLIDVLPHAAVQLVDHLGNGVLMPLQIRAEPRKIPKPVDDAGTAGGQRQRPHRHHARFHQEKHDAQEHAVADVRHVLQSGLCWSG